MTLCMILMMSLFTPSLAQEGTGQPMSDKIVGYWVSSSGTPLTISYSGEPVKAWLSIRGSKPIDLWLAGGARGGITLDYTTRDGTKMNGHYNESDDSISVSSQSGKFKATWRRKVVDTRAR